FSYFVISVRMLSVVIGIGSFLGLLLSWGKTKNASDKDYFATQLLSIVFAAVFLSLNYVYESSSNTIDYSTLSNLGLFIIVAGLMNILLFTRSLKMVVGRRKADIFFLLNALLSAYPIFIMFFLLFLLGIGFGPPS